MAAHLKQKKFVLSVTDEKGHIIAFKQWGNLKDLDLILYGFLKDNNVKLYDIKIQVYEYRHDSEIGRGNYWGKVEWVQNYENHFGWFVLHYGAREFIQMTYSKSKVYGTCIQEYPYKFKHLGNVF